MKDANGIEIVRGDILKDKYNNYRRVDYTGKKRIITAELKHTVQEAKEVESSELSWEQEEIDMMNFTIVQRRPLGVYDKNGEEWHYGDIVDETGQEVFEGIKSFNNGNADYIFVKMPLVPGGWSCLLSQDYTIRKPRKIEPKVSIKIEVNGKPIDQPLSVETARRLGVVK